jgi:predicted transposase/invertase (TIGR01784 family)
MLQRGSIEYAVKIGRAEGKAEGKEEGRAEGKEEGKAEGIRETARQLKLLGIDIASIMQATGLSAEGIDLL